MSINEADFKCNDPNCHISPRMIHAHNQAPGAWPNNRRIKVLKAEKNDRHQPGAQGRIIGSAIMPLEDKKQMLAYFVEWDDMPGTAITIPGLPSRIELMDLHPPDNAGPWLDLAIYPNRTLTPIPADAPSLPGWKAPISTVCRGLTIARPDKEKKYPGFNVYQFSCPGAAADPDSIVPNKAALIGSFDGTPFSFSTCYDTVKVPVPKHKPRPGFVLVDAKQERAEMEQPVDLSKLPDEAYPQAGPGPKPDELHIILSLRKHQLYWGPTQKDHLTGEVHAYRANRIYVLRRKRYAPSRAA